MGLINSIRENVLMGRFFDNHGLMLTFDKNVKDVVALLATLPTGNMQKLPVQVSVGLRSRHPLRGLFSFCFVLVRT